MLNKISGGGKSPYSLDNQRQDTSEFEKYTNSILINKKFDHIGKFSILTDSLPEVETAEDKGTAILAVTKLLTEVNRSTSQINDLHKQVKDFVFSNQDSLKELCNENRDLVGGLLVECLRCTNFALHDSESIESFTQLFNDLGFALKGDPQECADLATFSTLTYEPGTIVMEPY